MHPSKTQLLEYVTIATLGNVADFGDLTSTTARSATLWKCSKRIIIFVVDAPPGQTNQD